MKSTPSKQRVRSTPRFDSARCKNCGLCACVCPVASIEVPASEVPILLEPDKCTSCRSCEFICPDFAVTMAKA
ncbi:MAG: 4Fe-4S binding protein [Actinobacteria bacterium]|nr:4Fe-4S binding protein [Actinomycetota bacterium]